MTNKTAALKEALEFCMNSDIAGWKQRIYTGYEWKMAGLILMDAARDMLAIAEGKRRLVTEIALLKKPQELLIDAAETQAGAAIVMAYNQGVSDAANIARKWAEGV